MTSRVLVAYATKNGSTAEIAEAIGKELESSEVQVTVSNMKDVSSLEGYDAVVIGAPMYMGKVLKDCGVFAERYRNTLCSLPVAAFAVGIAPVEPRSGSVDDVLRKLAVSLVPVQPVSATVFAGKLDVEGLSFVYRKMVSLLKVPGGDFRDWKVITEWAHGIRPLLVKQ